jgi:hypothetical protein
MAILTGAAAGAVVFMLCVYVYRKGVGDGIKRKEKSIGPLKNEGEETENEIMRKYMALLSYDPYGDNREAFSGREGDRR